MAKSVERSLAESSLARLETSIDRRMLVVGGTTSMLLAGSLHLVIVPGHWGHSLAHGLALALMGVAQVVWAMAFWRRQSILLTRLGIVLAGGLIVLWSFTRVFAAPFHRGPEPITAADVTVKLTEFAAILFLSTLLALRFSTRGEPRAAGKHIWLCLAVALVGGTILYGLGLELGLRFPGLGQASSHAHWH